MDPLPIQDPSNNNSEETSPPASADTSTEASQSVNLEQTPPEEGIDRADRLLANWQRAEADLSNYRKRVEQEKAEFTRYAHSTIALGLLPIVDDLERALQSAQDQLAGLTWVDGIRLIYFRLKSVLEAFGIIQIEALGQEFNPQEHEAILYSEGEEGMVIEELQKGYKMHDRILRPTLVKVGHSDTHLDSASPQ